MRLLMCWGGVVDMRERLSRSRNAARIHSPPWPCCWLLHCPAGCGAPAVFRRGYWPLLPCRSPPGEGGRGRSPGGAKNPKRRRQRHAVKSAAMPRSSGGAGGTRASRAAAQRRAAARRARRGGPAAPGRRFEAAGGEPGGPQGQAQARPQTAAGGAHKAENKLPRRCAATARAAGGTEPPPRRSAGAQRGGGGRTSPRVTGAGRPRQGGAQAAARSAGAAQQAQPRGSRPGRAAMRRGCWRRPRGGRITGAHRAMPRVQPGATAPKGGGSLQGCPAWRRGKMQRRSYRAHGAAQACRTGARNRTHQGAGRARAAIGGRGRGRARSFMIFPGACRFFVGGVERTTTLHSP